MTPDTHTQTTARLIAPHEFKERLRADHIVGGVHELCVACGQTMPCDTIRLLDEAAWLLSGYNELQRLVPMTYATVAVANHAAAAARTIILGRQRRKPVNGSA